MGTCALDVERGVVQDIWPNPWQTDTCIGDWHYRRSLYEQHQYKTPETVVHTGHGDSTTIGDEAPHLEEWIARGH